MSNIVNAVDLLLQSTVPRLIPVTELGNVTVPTSNVIGLPDYYSAAKQVVLRATSQYFQTFTVGGTTPASIIVTADLKNILGTVTFTLLSGTATFTTGATTLTINAGDMTSASVVIQASVTFNSVVYSDQITLINTTEGSGVVLGYLSNESAIVPILTSPTVMSYDNSGGTFSVFSGTVNVTGTAVAYSVVSTTGVTVTIAPTGTYTISNLTANTGSATIRAIYAGTTIDKTYTVSKTAMVVDGAAGARGNVNVSRSISGAIWSDSEAALAISSAGYGAPQERDVVTLFNLSVNYSESKVYTGGTWIALTAYINGNLLVTGTILSAALATDSVTAVKIQAGAITAGKIAAGSVTADRLNVTGLATISSIISGTIRTATSGGRTEISDNIIKVFNDAGNLKVKIGNLAL